ncbi:MAG: hypothetical protein KatS3mg110_2553 [Pirellulaceae bacterium]|nr:MAG: hypothetical protein KatS3mg110_2553 [Pirellulaceae bacterium]
MIWVDLLVRVVHIGSATVLLGTLVTMLLIVGMPSQEDDAQWQRQRRRWSITVMITSALLLLSGLYNAILFASQYEFPTVNYHMWLGIKILLALVLMMAASVLSGRSGQAVQCRKNRWCGIVTLALAIAVVLVAGYLKMAERRPKMRGSATVIARPNGLIRVEAAGESEFIRFR